MVKDNRAACDYGRHSGHSTEEKIKRNFPGPDRRFHDGLTVVTGFARNRATGNVHPFARNDALLPRLLAQLFESLLVRHNRLRSASASLAALCASRNALCMWCHV